MINRAIENATAPPLIFNLFNQFLMEFVNEISAPIIKLEIHLCHTQAVERCIKLVSKVSEKVCGLTKRDVFIRTRLSSKRSMPSFETKGQYNQKYE